MNSEQQLETDIDTLKRDLSRFKEDLSTVLSDVGHYSQKKMHETKEKVGTSMKNLKNVASEKITQAGEIAHEKSMQAVNNSRKMIITKPFAAVALSFAFGVLATFLFERRKS